MQINIKDIISSVELGSGFVVIHNDSGYFLGIHETTGFELLQVIDKETYNSLEKREGNKI